MQTEKRIKMIRMTLMLSLIETENVLTKYENNNFEGCEDWLNYVSNSMQTLFPDIWNDIEKNIMHND